MGYYNFNRDLGIGEWGEYIVVKDLERHGIEFVADNKDSKYDLMMKYKERFSTYEVKTDDLCKPESDTTNIFIEYESREKETGISVTQADWFATFYPHLREIWYIRTATLRQLLKDNQFKEKVGGDKGSKTKGYLIPRYQFKNQFKVSRVPKQWLE